MSNIRILDLEIIRRSIDGIFYGPKVHVLIRRGDELLIWVPGHSAWDGTGRPWRYEPSSMLFHLPDRRESYRRICSGGRFKSRLIEHAAPIEAEFGEGIAKLIEPGKTLVIGDA